MNRNCLPRRCLQTLVRFVWLSALSVAICGDYLQAQDAAPVQDAAPALDAASARGTFTISEHTTRFTVPLNAHGNVEFANAVNLKQRGEITVETNAAVPLYQAFGPNPEGSWLSDEFYRQLGIDVPASEGVYFIGLSKFLKGQSGVAEELKNGAGLSDLYGRMVKAPWKHDELPEVVKWLESIHGPLQLVAEGAKRSEYFLPIIPPVAEDGQEGLMLAALLPGVQNSREVGRALIARAMWRLGEGQTLDAWSDLRTCHRLARLIGHGPTLIEGLVGVAIESMTIQAEIVFIEQAHPGRNLLAVIKRDLAKLPGMSPFASAVDVAERALFLDVVQSWAGGRQIVINDLISDSNDPVLKVLPKLAADSVNWDTVMRDGNRWYDSLALAMRQPGYQSRLEAFERIESEIKVVREISKDPAEWAKLLLPGQTSTTISRQVGNMLVSLLLPAAMKAQIAEDRGRQMFANLQATIALAEWKSRTGSWPDSLQELVPSVLNEVPTDLFSGKPLIYRRYEAGFLLYSVGQNQQDDDARTFGDSPAGDDLVIRLPVPVPGSTK